MIKKGNSETFHEQLNKLHEEIRQEWSSCIINFCTLKNEKNKHKIA